MNFWLLVIAGCLVLGILLIYLTMNRMKKGAYRNMIDELELLKYEISNKPIMFEIAKLRTVRKSPRIVSLVADWEESWKKLENQLKIVDDNIAYAEESLSSNDYDHADEIINVTKKDLAALTKRADALVLEIKNLKSSEFRNREGIVKLYEGTDELKATYESSGETYSEVSTQIEEIFTDIEELFDQFDEQMEESNYDLADEISEQIGENIALIQQTFDKIPLYRESIMTDAMPLLDGVLDSYRAMANDGIYLEHLDVETKIDDYKHQLDHATELMQDFAFDDIEALIVKVMTQAKKLRDAMKQELDVKETFTEDLERLKGKMNVIVKEGETLRQRYDVVKETCLMKADDADNFDALLREITIIDSGVKVLAEKIEMGDGAISNVHTTVLSYLEQTKEINEQLKIFDHEFITLQEVAGNIKAEAMTLLDDTNKLRAIFEKAPFNKNTSSLQVELDKADAHVLEFLEEANKTPMDVSSAGVLANATKSAVEKIKTKVSVAIEQLQMAERLLVYGNRYIGLEGMYLMDLTIAEDQFHQGNYENVIDKMYKLLSEIEGNSFFKVFEGLKQELGCTFI